MTIFAQLISDIGRTWARYGTQYLGGMWKTLYLALAGTAAGCLIGFVCGILSTIPCSGKDSAARRLFLRLIRALIRIYIEVFRGTPMILQAVFIYYGVSYFSGNAIHWNSIGLASILTVSINTGAYMAESVRGGFLSIDPGQTEGAKAIGMNHFQTMIYVIIPQAFRVLLPQIGNNLIVNIKDTSVMFIIGFGELFSVHRAAVGALYLYFPSAVIEMAAYLTMTLAASMCLRMLEKKMDGSANYELVMADQITAAEGMYTHPASGTPWDERNPEGKVLERRESMRNEAEEDGKQNH